jgi:hypothetical protein
MDRRRIMAEHLPRIEESFKCSPSCLICGGIGTVCEDHPDEPWGPLMGEGQGCWCGAAGEPCPHAAK